MNANLQRIRVITDMMARAEWVDSRLTFCDPAARNTFADCVLRTPHATIMRWFVPAGDIVQLHTHEESFEILVVEMGELPLQVGEERYDLGPGEEIRVAPGIPHGDYRHHVEDSIILGITIPPAPEFDEPEGVGNGSNARPDPHGDTPSSI